MFNRKTLDAALAWLAEAQERQYSYGFMGRPNGDGTFTFDVAGEPGLTWVRVWRGDTLSLEKATNQGAILNPYLLVRLVTVSGELVVERPVPQMARNMYGAYASTAAVPPHFQGPGATGIVADITPAEQLSPGLLRPAGGLVVEALDFWYAGQWYTGLTADLTSLVPATPEVCCWAVVVFDPASELLVTAASADSYGAVRDLPTDLAAAVSVSDLAVPLGAVALAEGQTDMTTTTRILDMRQWLGPLAAVRTLEGEAWFVALTTGKLAGSLQFAVQLRAAPSISLESGLGTPDCVSDAAGADVGAAAVAGRVSASGFCEVDDAGAPYTVGDWYRFLYTVQ